MIIELEGMKLSYECTGTGENIVLMHGWGGSMSSFKPVVSCLSKRYRVFALDLPGFGNSDLPPEPWGAADYGRFILKFLDQMPIERANIIAHSFGGRVAIWLAANFPEKVNKLVLVNSAGIKPRRKLKYYLKVAVAKIGKKIFLQPAFGKFGKLCLDKLYRLVGSKDYRQQTGLMRSTLVKIVNEDLRGLLSKILSPTLLVWGEDDKDVPLSSARIMEKEIKDAGLIVFKGAGHFSYLDRLSDFCLIAAKFFEDGQDIKVHG